LDIPHDPWALLKLAAGDNRETWRALARRAENAGIVASAGEADFWLIDPSITRILSGYLRLLPSDESRLMRAFVESMSLQAHSQHNVAKVEGTPIRRQMALHERNYLAALSIAVKEGLASSVINLLEALQRLYRGHDRLGDWHKIIELVKPVFIQASTDAALPGMEEYWSSIMSFRVQLLVREHSYARARELQAEVVEAVRSETVPWLGTGRASSAQSNQAIARLSAEIGQLGVIHHRDGAFDKALAAFQEAYELAVSANVNDMAQKSAVDLGETHLQMQRFEDADSWFSKAIGLNSRESAQALLGRSRVLIERATHDVSSSMSEDVLGDAIAYAREAIKQIGADDATLLGHAHSLLGRIYGSLGKFDQSIESYETALIYRKSTGDNREIGRTQGNLAGVLEATGYRRRAMSALKQASESFEMMGESGQTDLEYTRKQIERIKSKLGHA
jgi:tetratricopeptide (TPR) repeat protein